MKKKSTSRSAFFNLRVLIGLFVFLAGVFLALLGFGAFSNVFAQPRKSASASAGKSLSHNLSDSAVQLSPADREGRFVYLIEFAEPGLLRRQGRAPGEGFNPDTPEAKTQREQLIREQANMCRR